MGPSYLPRLVNGPFDDPALFVPFRHQNRALLFDLGDVSPLPARDILKITHIFVTHTHMDHFAGFDRVLRLFLGREKDLHLIGPQGFLANLAGKLAGYSWNLVKSYPHRFTLHAMEVHPDRIICCRFPCRSGFVAHSQVHEIPFGGIILSEPALTVRAVHLDHGIPVLAFALDERLHINILKDALDRMDLLPGPWLNRFKALVYGSADPETIIEIPAAPNGIRTARLSLGRLQTTIARISPGQRLVYIADATGTPKNIQKMIALAEGADLLFIEAVFSHAHREIARRKHHLTARQAGEIARASRVKQVRLFHYSPRYTDSPETLETEALAAFNGQPGTDG